MSQRSTTFAEVIREAIRSSLEEVRVALPASVQSYDPATQTVSVQPLIKRVATDLDGNEAVESLPQIPKVPLLFMRTAQYAITLPVAVGDIVLLVIADRALDRWRTQGGEVDPGSLRTHDLSDAVAIPGLFPTASAIPAAAVSSTGLALGKIGGPVVHATSAAIELGGTVAVPPTSYVALATPTDTRIGALESKINALITKYNLHIHPTPAGPSSATVSTETSLAAGTSTAATKVKAL